MDKNDKDLEKLLLISLLEDEEDSNIEHANHNSGADSFVSLIGIGLLVFGIMLLLAIITG